MTDKQETKIVPEKPCKMDYPAKEEFVALGIKEVAAIIAAALEIKAGNSIAIIEGAKFDSLRPKQAIFVPGKHVPAVPCVVLKLKWEEEKKNEITVS
jgi:hypothetical protein